METREYFEKVMQDYNQNRKGRSLRKYCKEEAARCHKISRETLILLLSTHPYKRKSYYEDTYCNDIL